LEKRCLEMADKCEDLMGKYKSMLRRTTQVEMSVGILRSTFETYPPQQFDLTVLEEDVLDSPITLGNHVVASGPRTLEETLGTRTQIPTRHMLDTLGVQTTSDSNVLSGQKLGLLKMYS